MNPITHLLVSWVIADSSDLEKRDRAVVTLSGIVPDIDSFGIVAEQLTNGNINGQSMPGNAVIQCWKSFQKKQTGCLSVHFKIVSGDMAKMPPFLLLLILFASITVFPEVCLACGICVDYAIDYGLPFIKFWIPLFLIWAYLRLRINSSSIKRKGQSSSWYVFRSILSAVFVIGVISFISMGSLLTSFLLFFVWWLLKAVIISVRRDPGKSSHLPWWQNANRIMIACTLLLIAYVYAFQFSDLDRLTKFLRYPGGPYGAVKEKVIQIGEPAIPMVVNELIIKSPKAHHGGEPSYKEGISILEQITGHNFDGSREGVLDWWYPYEKSLKK